MKHDAQTGKGRAIESMLRLMCAIVRKPGKLNRGLITVGIIGIVAAIYPSTIASAADAPAGQTL